MGNIENPFKVQIPNVYKARIVLFPVAHDLRKSNVRFVATFEGELGNGYKYLELRWRDDGDESKSKGIIISYTTDEIDVFYSKSDHWERVRKAELSERLIKELQSKAEGAPNDIVHTSLEIVKRERLKDKLLNKN